MLYASDNVVGLHAQVCADFETVIDDASGYNVADAAIASQALLEDAVLNTMSSAYLTVSVQCQASSTALATTTAISFPDSEQGQELLSIIARSLKRLLPTCAISETQQDDPAFPFFGHIDVSKGVINIILASNCSLGLEGNTQHVDLTPLLTVFLPSTHWSMPDFVSAQVKQTFEELQLPASVSFLHSYMRNPRRAHVAVSPTATCSQSSLCLSDGTYVLTISAVDVTGNVGSASSSVLTVDSQPPSVTLQTNPPKLVGRTAASSLSFAFSCNEAVVEQESACSFFCALHTQLDGALLAPCSSPLSVSASSGVYFFSIQAVDRAGNTGALLKYSFSVDATAPKLTLSRSPAASAVASIEDTLVFASVSEPSSLFCAVTVVPCAQGDAACGSVVTADDFAACSFPSLLSDVIRADLRGLALNNTLLDGTRVSGSINVTLHVKATDVAGNTNTESQVLSWLVDREPPLVLFDDASLPAPVSANDQPAFVFSAIKGGQQIAAEFQCMLLMASTLQELKIAQASSMDTPTLWIACSSPHTPSVRSDTYAMLAVRAVDAAQNIGPAATVTWQVYAAAPALQLLAAASTSRLFNQVAAFQLGKGAPARAGLAMYRSAVSLQLVGDDSLAAVDMSVEVYRTAVDEVAVVLSSYSAPHVVALSFVRQDTGASEGSTLVQLDASAASTTTHMNMQLSFFRAWEDQIAVLLLSISTNGAPDLVASTLLLASQWASFSLTAAADASFSVDVCADQYCASTCQHVSDDMCMDQGIRCSCHQAVVFAQRRPLASQAAHVLVQLALQQHHQVAFRLVDGKGDVSSHRLLYEFSTDNSQPHVGITRFPHTNTTLVCASHPPDCASSSSSSSSAEGRLCALAEASCVPLNDELVLLDEARDERGLAYDVSATAVAQRVYAEPAIQVRVIAQPQAQALVVDLDLTNLKLADVECKLLSGDGMVLSSTCGAAATCEQLTVELSDISSASEAAAKAMGLTSELCPQNNIHCKLRDSVISVYI